MFEVKKKNVFSTVFLIIYIQNWKITIFVFGMSSRIQILCVCVCVCVFFF